MLPASAQATGPGTAPQTVDVLLIGGIMSATLGVLSILRSSINSTPHVNLVWGEDNVAYRRRRYEALGASPLFSGMEFTTDPTQIARWVPLMMEGRGSQVGLAATPSPLGTDCEWGEVTRQYVASFDRQAGFTLTTGYEVRRLARNPGGGWHVRAKNIKTGAEHVVNARFVFAGVGGGALHMLQASDIPAGGDYGGFPVGGSFLVADNRRSRCAIGSRSMARRR